MEDTAPSTSGQRYHMAHRIRIEAVRNSLKSLDKMVVIVMECLTREDLRHTLFDQDRWFEMHPSYGVNFNEGWYWFGDYDESYCNDEGMQLFEKQLWSVALGKLGRSDWVDVLDTTGA